MLQRGFPGGSAVKKLKKRLPVQVAAPPWGRTGSWWTQHKPAPGDLKLDWGFAWAAPSASLALAGPGLGVRPAVWQAALLPAAHRPPARHILLPGPSACWCAAQSDIRHLCITSTHQAGPSLLQLLRPGSHAGTLASIWEQTFPPGRGSWLPGGEGRSAPQHFTLAQLGASQRVTFSLSSFLEKIQFIQVILLLKM